MLTDTGTSILAGSVLVAGLLACVAWGLRDWRRSHYTFGQYIFSLLNLVWARWLWRARVIGTLPYGPQQGAVIVCNHTSSLDSAYVALTTRRMVHWMVAKEYCEHPLFAWACRIFEVIPVSRGGVDTAATKAAIRCVEQGGLLGLFPEGRINRSDKLMLPGRLGAAMIALKARVPIVPCYVQGAPYDGTSLGCLLMPAHVTLFVGAPIDVAEYADTDDDKEAAGELTRRILGEIGRLARDHDYQPELAGRPWRSDADSNAA